MMAKQYGIKISGKTKSDLIREIQRNEGNFDCFGTAANSCDQMECCFRSIC
jgi:hypothetical protein